MAAFGLLADDFDDVAVDPPEWSQPSGELTEGGHPGRRPHLPNKAISRR